MNLQDFKKHIESLSDGTIFKNGISNPFSWRGNHDEVAFSIILDEMTREEMLIRIGKAYTETFFGWNGSKYKYSYYTVIHFEKEGYSNWSGGKYTAEIISKLENSEQFNNQEERLVRLAFY